MSTVHVNRVSKRFRQDFWGVQVTAVDDLSFTIDKNEITGFVGPNGAGKTTTIKMILGLVRPGRGSVTIDGREAADPRSRLQVAYVSEQPYFYDYLTVLESMRFLGQLRDIARTTLAKQVPDILERLGLTEHATRKVRTLSKGNQQRLNFAQALLGDPSIFILDEPMSGLDPLGRRLFREIFRDLAGRGKTIFFSTHILEDIESLCERVLVLSRGRKVYDGAIPVLLEAGFTGTELTVPRLDSAARNYFTAAGCILADPLPGTTTIFVPKEGNLRSAQQWLAEKGIFCTAIARRTGSLETLLYKDTSIIESL
jgi:ABC-2 type transport system ATP-binding protein